MNDFDQKARDWDKNKMHLERTVAVAAQLQKMVPSRPGMKAMEFGAGTGLLSFYMKERFSEITLIDSSVEMLQMAEKKMENDDHLKFRTLFLNLETERYTGEPFDIIYSQMVLHHIKDVKAILTTFRQLLAPGGILAIADLYLEDGSFHDGATNVHHGFDPGSLQKMLLEQGFQAFRIEPCFVMHKAISENETKDYPVFLMTATS
ncbi:MAG: class I SAM-dependent methyltransferase [Bacteroidota bacterium]